MARSKEKTVGTYDEFMRKYLPKLWRGRKSPEELHRDALRRIIRRVKFTG